MPELERVQRLNGEVRRPPVAQNLRTVDGSVDDRLLQEELA